MLCFLIVAAIATAAPASAPRPSAHARATVAHAVPEPPPMVRGQRSAYRSIRRLAADEAALASPVPPARAPAVARR